MGISIAEATAQVMRNDFKPCRFLGLDSRSRAAGEKEEDRCMNKLGGKDKDGRQVKLGGFCPYYPNDWKSASIYCTGYKE